MLIRFLMVFSFIYFCVTSKTNPARYFQINAPYFNESKGIFSKLDIDKLIPQRWRLRQCLDSEQCQDFVFPVFLKPEWGQNSHGIRRADDAEQLNQIRQLCADNKIPNIIQEAATEAREFEIFVILSASDKTQPAVLTVSEATNSELQLLPVNGIYNPNTIYRDLTASLTSDELEAIWRHVSSMGHFGISRVGVRSNSIDSLVKGNFHVIEINLFVPMPINLLDPDKTVKEKVSFVLSTMRHLARIVKYIPRDQCYVPVFFKKWQISRKVRMLPLAQ